MPSTVVHIPVRSILNRVTMHVHVNGVKLWTARIWLGTKILKCAALVMGCGLRVEVEK
jgi:hypothetical protein